jgi:MFS family permease
LRRAVSDSAVTAVPRTLTAFVVYPIGGVGRCPAMTGQYIAELAPARLRGTLVSWNQFAVVFGMLVVYFVNYVIAGVGDEAWNATTGWRWMFGSEALPACLFLLLLLFVPESPRWLAKRGRLETAREILMKVDGAVHADAEMTEIESALRFEGDSFRELFQSKWRPVLGSASRSPSCSKSRASMSPLFRARNPENCRGTKTMRRCSRRCCGAA